MGENQAPGLCLGPLRQPQQDTTDQGVQAACSPVLEAGKCKIKVPGHLVSVRTCFLVHPWPSFSLCPHRTKGAFSWLFYKGTNTLRGLRLHDLIMPKAPPPNTLTLEIRFHLTFSLFITLRLWNQNFWSSICMTLASPFTSSFLFHISKWTS